MPLSRYEIRSEYSLANPDLYRAADKDDPEGLLEGVAMAGLVGIIRQLGDLAEFAAEVFHDLHEDVLATAARGHELLVRVRQLEREVPLIENLMFTKTDRGNFMYNPGVEWHVHIHNEQNHFTQGDLPRFIRSAYEDCRSPPRLFVLDRFDVTGAGACLKRFTDPSFFKMEWASSELLKAEKEQRDQKARRLKKKGPRQENGEVREARIASHVKLRVPSEVENAETESAETSSIPSSSASSSNRFEQDVLDSLKQENEDMLTASSSLFSGQDGPQLKGIDVEHPMVEEPSSLKHEVSSMETSKDVSSVNEGLKNGLKGVEIMAEDSASETENFLDAVTTMDSEVETDTETRAEVAFVDLVNITENEAPGSQLVSESPREASGEQIRVDDNLEHMKRKVKEAVVIGEDCLSGVLMPEVLSGTEQGFLVEDAPIAFPEKEDLSFVNDHFVTCPAQTIDALTLDSPSGASSSSVEEDAVAKSAELSTDNVLRDYEKSSLFLDGSCIVPSPENNVVSASVNGSGTSSPVLEEEVLSSSNRSLQLERTEHVVTTSETLDTDEFLRDRPSAHFSQLEESGVLGNQNQSPKVLGAVGTRKRWQLDKLFDKVILAPDLAIDSSQASESEQGESPKKLSLHSSPSSSIQPMRWAIGSSKSYHTDDEIVGLQGSLGSLSSSSSTLSSPRPSTLATTLQSLSLGGKQKSSSPPQKSADSSPPSPVCSPPESGVTAAVHEGVSLAEEFTESAMSPASEHSDHSSPHSSSSAVQPFFDSLPSLGLNLNTTCPENMVESLSTQNVGGNNMESFPPPPPLPPLAWRMTRRSHSAVVGTSEPVKSPTQTLSQRDVDVLTNKPPQVFRPSTSVPANSGVEHMPNDSMQSLTHETCPSEMKALHEKSEEMLKASKLAGSCAPRFILNADASQEVSVSVLAPSRFERENNVSVLPDSSLHENLLKGSHTFSTGVLQAESTPARLDKTRSEPEAISVGGYGAWPLASKNFERKDFSAAATTSHDNNRFKRRSKWALTSSTASSDDREVLLEQIRTRSFSLRNASAEKVVASRPVTNINVAAILEKANAIRQAFAGSDDDEDDEWSDT